MIGSSTVFWLLNLGSRDPSLNDSLTHLLTLRERGGGGGGARERVCVCVHVRACVCLLCESAAKEDLPFGLPRGECKSQRVRHEEAWLPFTHGDD